MTSKNFFSPLFLLSHPRFYNRFISIQCFFLSNFYIYQDLRTHGMCPGVICTQTCGNCECTWSGERRERLLRRFGAEEAQLPLISSQLREAVHGRFNCGRHTVYANLTPDLIRVFGVVLRKRQRRQRVVQKPDRERQREIWEVREGKGEGGNCDRC